MGRALEWLLFLAAATGLLVWVMRTVQRQRLRVALGDEPCKQTAWARETEDWRRQAEQEATKGAWREAIHAIYWAAIVHLERRRAWRHNPSRTPREYVRLLKAGSAEQRELWRAERLAARFAAFGSGATGVFRSSKLRGRGLRRV